jgi:alpha-L-arabinofuranosidase
MRRQFPLGCVLVAATIIGVQSASADETTAAGDSTESIVTLKLDQAKARIAPEIYGKFAEHLGHCIYGGIWVGEDSPIANTRGIRNDIVAALKEIKVPVLAGRILTAADLTAHNTFNKPEAVTPDRFHGAKIENGTLGVELPAKSIVTLQLK